MFFVKDRNRRYISCNNQYANILGYDSSTNIIGKTDEELLRDYNNSFVNIFGSTDEQILKGSQIVHKVDMVVKDDKPTCYLISKFPLKENENFLGIFCIAICIQDIINSNLYKNNNSDSLYLKNIVSRMPGSIYWKDKMELI